MAFSNRKSWDLTHLSSKYPWLRVDAETIAEFRSPFQWVDAPPKPKATRPQYQQQHGADGGDEGGNDSGQSGGESGSEERNESVRFSLSGRKVTESSTSKSKKHKHKPLQHAHGRWKKPQQRHAHAADTKKFAAFGNSNAKHGQVLNSPVSSEHGQTMIPALQDLQSSEKNNAGSLHRIPSVHESSANPGSLLLPLSKTDALYEAMTHSVQRKSKKKKNIKKKSRSILSLSFPVLSNSIQGKPSASATNAPNSIHQSNVLAIQYSKQLKDLAQAEQKLKEQVSSQIEAEKAKLPLSFLFERNLDRMYCREKSIATITQIFTKLQHRLMFASFERWWNFVHALQSEERKDAAFKRSQVQALAFFEKLASNAYVGTIGRVFTRWRQTTQDIVESERHQAATTIQVRFRQRRAKELLRGLKQASLDKESKRKVEIQQLLRFEAYGKAMRWSTLRNGFNLLLQNHCARRIQFFFRHIMVQKRILKRIVRREAAIMVQKPWRGKLAQRELARRKELLKIRQALENAAAVQIQVHARSYLARKEVKHRREWLSNENQRALEIQICWRKYRERLELHSRFALRKLLLDTEKERLAQLEREKELQRLEMARHAAALDIQRVYRGFQGRKAFKAKLYERDLELATRRVQTSWRKSKGRYVLQLRFSAQRNRIEARKQEAALQIQCCYRVFRSKQTLGLLRADLRQRQRAATNIQRVYRGRRERSQYQQTRRATITIQSGMKCKLARRERQRRLDRKLAEFKVMTEAATILQKWTRGMIGRMLATRMRELKAREEQLTKSAALLIQKRARGIETRKTANLLRETMKIVDLQQKRRFQGSKRDASPLLEFMTTYYLNKAPDTENGENGGKSEISGGGGPIFTYKQSVWLQERIQEAHLQILKEDKAIVFLQRMYRGFVARVGYVVRKLRAKQRRELEVKMAIVIQKYARGFLAHQQVKKLRHKRRMDEIKDAYIRERKWKEDEQKWKEQYQREQMELQIRKAKAMELKLREAKRGAELAKWRAEEATFRKQELLAQQELDKQERARKRLAKVNGHDEEEKEEKLIEEEGWTEMVDAYGNKYFYNEAKSESTWERPMKQIKKSTASLESSKTESQKNSKKLPQYGDPSKPESADASATEKSSAGAAADGDTLDKADDAVPEGCCWKCRVSLATKECLDCSDDTHRKFCTSCFMSEHYSLPAESGDSRQKHDFRVLVKAKNRSQCQSLACRSKDLGQANLATYYCGECAVLPKSTTSAAATSLESNKGCFYCEECFPKAHESAQELQHVPSALHFHTGALLCCDCNSRIGTMQCEQCDESFCSACFETIHAQSQKKREHMWTSIELLKEELSDSGRDTYCIECDLRGATRLCNLCGDGFCDLCFVVAHEKGKKQQHTWISWESFSQVGDWLEIFDEKANTKIFFNIETKESTIKQPFVLKSGADRHLLQFQEREQLQKHKEIELENEIVSLKEKIKEITEKEALAQRPLSRNLCSSGGNRPDASRNISATEPAAKEKKKGMLGKLFSRKSRVAVNGKADDGFTSEERKKRNLRESIKGEEQALMMSKMKTRVREEKEAKAAQTLGTKQFETSILQELAS